MDVRTEWKARRGILTSVIVGCKDGEVVILVGQVGQKLVTGASGIDRTECRSETGEACIVQGLNEARDVGGVVLGISQSGGESQDQSRGNENHVSGSKGGEGEALRRYEDRSCLRL